MNSTLLISGALFVLLALWAGLSRWSVRRLSRRRIFEVSDATPFQDGEQSDAGAIVKWLSLAGYRDASATNVFLGLSALGLALGIVIPFLYVATGLSDRLIRGLSVIPGAVGEIFLPFVYLAPWTLFLILACLPWLFVRRTRRQRVQQFEEDLPIYLELFATLSEAGLGFDAALDRILKSQPAGRPLAEEFRMFQTEVLGGRPRIRCLRRLATRVEVTAFTIFVSALVQAEQIGSGVATVLRRQADDLRDRRRESFLAKAMSLPVKLVFPLVICFLPGIFVVTLGPVFYQFFQFADGLMRNRGALP